MITKNRLLNDSVLSFLNESAADVAPRLLGYILERELDGQILRAKIVETEAYDQTDAASHSYKGKTPRSEIMFGDAGHLYVYFTYGMHYCCNVVTDINGVGSAVLIRAVEPLNGQRHMEINRGKTGIDIANGPAKLCQAMLIDKALNGHDLTKSPLRLVPGVPVPSKNISVTKRIGISKDKDRLWRFYINDSLYVSKK